MQKTLEVPQLQFSDKVADMPVVVLKTLLTPVEIPQVQFLDKVEVCPLLLMKPLKPVETAQVQYLDKVFLQFIDHVVDISVVAQRPFTMVPVFPKPFKVHQLQYIDKEVDVAVVQVQVRALPEAREASTGAVLGQGFAVHQQGR